MKLNRLFSDQLENGPSSRKLSSNNTRNLTPREQKVEALIEKIGTLNEALSQCRRETLRSRVASKCETTNSSTTPTLDPKKLIEELQLAREEMNQLKLEMEEESNPMNLVEEQPKVTGRKRVIESLSKSKQKKIHEQKFSKQTTQSEEKTEDIHALEIFIKKETVMGQEFFERIKNSFQNFSYDSLERTRIAKLCAQKDGGLTASHLALFALTDEKSIIEILTLCAENDGGSIAENVKSFPITDPNGLIEIAQACAKSDPGRTACAIKQFGITDQMALVQIAKLCAAKDGVNTAFAIKEFEITDQESLGQIAQVCAANNGGMAYAIERFGITDQKTLVQIAKVCTKTSPGTVADAIQQFGITNQADLIEIAKLCAQQNGKSTAYAIKKFGITDQDALIDIAKLCAIEAGWDIAGVLDNFGITNTTALDEIQNLCSRNSGMLSSESTAPFQLEEDSIKSIIGEPKEVMVYGFHSAHYEEVQQFLKPKGYSVWTWQKETLINARTHTPVKEIGVMDEMPLGKYTKRQCKASLTSLLFENYKRTQRGEPLVPLIFCLGVDEAMPKSESVVKEDRTTWSELRRMYKFCTEFENDPEPAVRELSKIAKEMLKVVRLVSRGPNMYSLESLPPLWESHPNEWLNAWHERLDASATRRRIEEKGETHWRKEIRRAVLGGI